VSPGLVFLLRRTARGKARQALRRAKTPKGALAFGFGAIFLVGITGVQLWSLTLDLGMEADPAELRTFLPPALLVLCVLGALSGKALYFTPAEVDFLFPAPVGRRELLVYNLLSRVGVQVLSGLWVSLFVVRHAPVALNGVLATVLSMVFLYVGAQAVAVAGSAGDAWVPVRARRPVRVALLGAGIALLLAALARGTGVTPGARMRAVLETPVMQAIALPARPFAELFGAPGIGEGSAWAAACLGVIAAVVGLVLAWDVAYTERSLAVSARQHARMARMRSGGGVHAGGAPTRLRLTVPRLRWMGAAGALAWRQLTELARTPKAMLVPLIGAAAWVGALLFAFRDADPSEASAMASMIVSVCLLLPVLFSGHVAFDFRRDLDRMDLLRSLPVSPGVVAAGQVLPVALVFALMQYLVAGVSAAAGALPGAWLAALAMVIPPYAWATVAVENGVFLVMPYRVTPGDDQRMQFLGKVMLAMFLKFVIVGILAGVAVLAAWGVLAMTGSRAAAIGVGCVAMAAGCVPLTWLVGRAFAGFDLGRDVPA
jgi:ABC-2 type transport system permease protein